MRKRTPRQAAAFQLMLARREDELHASYLVTIAEEAMNERNREDREAWENEREGFSDE